MEETKKRFWEQKKFLKYRQGTFYKNLVATIFKYVLLTGLSFIIVYPFIYKISSAFMSKSDLADKTVNLIPRSPTLINIFAVIEEGGYFEALFNTLLLSLVMGALQMIACLIIGYGLGKFNFKGSKLVFALVIFTMIIPAVTLETPYFMFFRDFDIYGIFHLIFGKGIPMLDTYSPVVMLSLTGLGFKNGLYIFLFRQYFSGVPKELTEAAQVDGCGILKTFFRIMMPQARAMMLTVFLFGFAWQWTDSYYSTTFFPNKNLLSTVIGNAPTLSIDGVTTEAQTLMSGTLSNTAAVLVVLPLMIIYFFAQKRFVEGIESSGIVG